MINEFALTPEEKEELDALSADLMTIARHWAPIGPIGFELSTGKRVIFVPHKVHTLQVWVEPVIGTISGRQ